MEQAQHELAGLIDHTLLRADATTGDIERLCTEARAYRFATVCVNSVHVPRCHALLAGSQVGVCAVVGFPLGAMLSVAKAFEASEAVRGGATEIDMVAQLGALSAGGHAAVLEDIEQVVQAARPACVKVILETALLDDEAKAAGCRLAQRGGARFVKTSTGFGPGGATVEDVRLMARLVGNAMGVKASGGIRTREAALQMVAAGATRIGTSSGVAIVGGGGQQ